MPIYEYECTNCGAVMEAWQKFSDKPLATCKQCSGKLRKIISQSSFHLKGTGWYATDYAHKSGGAPAPAKKKKTESENKSAENKPDAE